MTEKLTRRYHGHEVVSTMNEKPVENSDGWTHQVDGNTFPTLAEAIRHARDRDDEAEESPESVGGSADPFFETDDETIGLTDT